MGLKTRKFGASAAAAAVALSIGLAGCTTPDPGSGPTPNPGPGPGPVTGNQKGPDPTDASLSARRGPFAVGTASARGARGFGGGTVHYPTDTSLGRMGGVAVAPGFMSLESSIKWYGPLLASHGFVVITIDTNTLADQPGSRGRQLQAALDYLTKQSSVASRVDPTRLATMGWSMGGGGALDTAESNPNVKAIVPLAPWHMNTRRGRLNTPTLVVSCAADAIAPNAMHSDPIYRNLGSSEKAQFTVSGISGHMCVTNTPDTGIGKMTVAWLKRFVDDDTRYSSFVCAGPGRGYTDFKSTCPV